MEIWHNPRCSKSRQTLAVIEEAGLEPKIRRYLDQPPTEVELEAALTALGLEPWEITRMGEAAAKELGLADAPHEREAWIKTLAENPTLIERPIVLDGQGQAVLGRPPENVGALLGD